MPGVFRRAWSKVTRGDDARRAKQERSQHKLTKKERKHVERQLSSEYRPRVWSTKRSGRTERDFFYLARAEAKRQRRRRIKVQEMLAGGYGEETRLRALETMEVIDAPGEATNSIESVSS